MEGIGRDKFTGRSPMVGFGYISIPIDIPREKFISLCYTKERVNVWLTDNPTIIKNCPIEREVLSEIEFPSVYNERGSLVVFVTHHTTGKPVIIGRISKEYEGQLLEEKSWKKQFIDGENSASIFVRGKKGEICLSVGADTDEGGNITIDVSNKQNNGILNLNCDGKVNINANDNIYLKTSKNIKLETVSVSVTGEETVNAKVNIEDGNIGIEGGQVNIDGDQIKFSTGAYKATRAEEIKTQLDILQAKVDLIINAINIAPIVPADGGASFKASLIATLETAIDASFTNIGSEKVSID